MRDCIGCGLWQTSWIDVEIMLSNHLSQLSPGHARVQVKLLRSSMGLQLLAHYSPTLAVRPSSRGTVEVEMQRFAIHDEPQWCLDGCTRGSRWGDSACVRISATSTGRFDRRNSIAVAICSCRNPVCGVLGGGWYRQREACSVAALGR
jgi:hypothetical protein